MGNRDVYFTRDAARLAAFDHVVRHGPYRITMPVVLEEMITQLVDGYENWPENAPFGDFVAEQLATRYAPN